MDFIDVVPVRTTEEEINRIVACVDAIGRASLLSPSEVKDKHAIICIGHACPFCELSCFSEEHVAIVIDSASPLPFARVLHIQSNDSDEIWKNKISEFLACEKRRENKPLLQEFAKYKLHGRSQLFIDVISTIKQVAKHEAPVLIEGETGTGKENTARAIHYLSARQNHAFIPVNCAAIPENLIESELFGHTKGAFTGADSNQRGLIDLANGGTLFLDEVDSLSAKAQAVLLRFLQTGEYHPVGSPQIKHADTHVIAATNRKLLDKIQDNTFREDLYYRLNVLKIKIPPLRERRQDIETIAQEMLASFKCRYQRPDVFMSENYLAWLRCQNWPGNVRELENTLLRKFLMTEGKVMDIDSDSLLQENTSTSPLPSFKEAKEAAIEAFEKSYVEKMLAVSGGNVSLAARYSGKERRAFGKLIKKYSIEKAVYQ